MTLETGEVRWIGRQTAAGGDEMFRERFQLVNDFGFELAESGFAVLGEDLRNRFADARLDELIRIQKREVQRAGDQLSDGRFPGAHEADEGEIVDLPRAAHQLQLADSHPARTQKGLFR